MANFLNWFRPAASREGDGRRRYKGTASEHGGGWHIHQRRLTRLYAFPCVPTSPETTLLKLECSVSRQLNGTVYTYAGFDLHPYLYLIPNGQPFPDHLVSPPFTVSLFASGTGEGTEPDPVFRGGFFEMSACSIEEQPDTASLGIYNNIDAAMWAKTLSFGTSFGISIIAKDNNRTPLLGLEMHNDPTFSALYRELINAA
jgi:hypothetical protein